MPMSLPQESRQESSASRLPSRRAWLCAGGLTVGALGMAGVAPLGLPQLLAAEQRGGAGTAAAADHCIVLMLNGGPSHLDMWDMKPAAPVEIRGEFQPIATSLPGVQFSEHLPRLARLADQVTLVRSMHHSVNNAHAAAVYTALTGHDRGEIGGGALRTDHPPVGSVLSKLRPGPQSALPYVALPYKTKEGAGGPLQPGFQAGFLGQAYDPFWVLDDPNGADFRVPNLSLAEGVSAAQFQDRGALLTRFNARFDRYAAERQLAALDRFQQQAVELLTGNAAQQAFRVQEEEAATREAYGRNIYGQSVLVARRLIEAGTRFVTVSWAPDANATWDTHGQNFAKLKRELLPQFDLACSALLRDLTERGLLDRTVVAVLGDFGRTPKINNNAGRDHWNACYTILLAGGGFRAGYVHGASDRQGALPAEKPVTPGDIIATLYRQFGIDAQQTIYDALDRPHAVVPRGTVLRDLLA